MKAASHMLSVLVLCHSFEVTISLSMLAPKSTVISPYQRSSSVMTWMKSQRITSTQLKGLPSPISRSNPVRKRWKCEPCLHETKEDNDLDIDRREAAFAMIGNLWSRGMIPTMVVSTLFSFPARPVHAAFGSDANIQLPNVLEGLNDRVSKQCLVESLGNRECLVYMDPENKLYKGTDSNVLLDRLETTSVALATVPALVENKQWSKIQSVITGPMGNILTTMMDLANISDNPERALDLAKKVKLDLYAISAAVERKQVELVIKAHESTTADLVAFASSL